MAEWVLRGYVCLVMLPFNAALYDGYVQEGYWLLFGYEINPLLTIPIFLLFICAPAALFFRSANNFRDELAYKALDSRSGESVVYLRPFAVDFQLSGGEGPYLLSPLRTLTGYDFISGKQFESSLLKVIDKRFTVVKFDTKEIFSRVSWPVKLSRPFMHRLGAIKLPESCWMETVETQLIKSKFCVVVPPTSTILSTAKEIKFLIQRDLLHKAVFVMPPKSSTKYRTADGNKIDEKMMWEALCKIFEEINIHLPQYDKLGGLVFIRERKGVLLNSVEGKNWQSQGALKRIFFGKLLNDKPLLDSAKVALRLAIILPLSIFLVSLFLPVIVDSLFVEPSPIIISFGLALCAWGIALCIYFSYQYCRKFMLQRAQAIAIFLFGLIQPLLYVFILAFAQYVDSLDFLMNRLIALVTNFSKSINYVMEYDHALTLVIVSSYLICSYFLMLIMSYWFMRGREKLTLLSS